MSQPYLLAIDCGTQSVRALVFDAGGHLVDKAQVMLDGYEAPQPGWAECDPEDFWRAVCRACQHLWANRSVPAEAIRGMVLTTQRGSVVALDADGRPLRPAILWLDQRRADVDPVLRPWWELALRAAGMRGTIRYFAREAEANWIAHHEPALWARCARFTLLSGWLNWRLTGRYADSVANQVGYIPFDYRRGRWASDWNWKWQCLPVRRAMLPELVPAGSVLGRIDATAARDSGLPEGLPVIAGAADKACEVLGAGCLAADIACLSYGTAATINVTTPRYLEATRFIPPYPAAVPGRYNAEVQISRGFWLVRWFREQFGLAEEIAAARQGVAPESLFDELVAAVPPGAQGLMLQPFWNPGIKLPGPEARGAVIGFGEVHTRAHLFRAILEGLAYALREGRERIERRGGTRIRRVRVAGGGSQSDAALQITADVFNLPAERPHLYEASGLGAAMIAAVGFGMHRDFETAVREMTRVGRTFEPDPAHARSYDALYRRVYCHMYERLRPLYREIADITA